LTQRQWSPNDWQSTLKGLAGGNATRYKELLNQYEQDHAYLNQADFAKGFGQDQTKIYAQEVNVNRAAMVNASYAFNTINTHLKNIHQLSQKIDQAQNT